MQLIHIIVGSLNIIIIMSVMSSRVKMLLISLPFRSIVELIP